MNKTKMQEIVSRLRYAYNSATQGVWRRGIGSQSRELCLQSGPLLATVYGGFDNTFIEEAHNNMPYLLGEIERLQLENDRLQKELDRSGELMGTV